MRTSSNIYRPLAILLLAGSLFWNGCTKQDAPEQEQATSGVEFGISLNSILGKTVNGVTVSSVRILAVDPSTGFVAFNRTAGANLLPDAGGAGNAGKFAVSLKPGGYYLYVIGNETASMTAVLNSLTNGLLLEGMTVQGNFTEANMVLSTRTRITVRPQGNVHTATTGEVMIQGQSTWQQTLPIALERLATKISFALKKNTSTASDQFIVKRVAIVQLPLYSYVVSRAYDGSSFRSVVLYDNSTGISFTQNGAPAVSFGQAIVPEYLLTTQSTDYASSIKVLATYNNTVDVIYTIPLRRNLAVADYNLYRDSHYNITATITQVGDINYTPYIEYNVADWTDAVGEDLNIGGSVTYTGSWSASTPSVDNQTKAVYSNGYAEYSFTLANPSGATWRASLTNGLDFAFDYSDNAVSSGITAPGQPRTIRIKPLRPVSVSGVQTKLYITVSNISGQVELDLVPGSPGMRYTITQIPQ